MSRRIWSSNWFKPANLIALVTLVVTALGVWGGIKLFNTTQEVTGGKDCEISDVDQRTSSEGSSAQKVECSGGGKIEGVKQERN